MSTAYRLKDGQLYIAKSTEPLNVRWSRPLYQTQNKNSYILLNYVIEIGCLYKKLLIGFGIRG